MAFPTLQLTSPHRKGEAVRIAQYLLRKNRVNQDFLGAKIDGEFGPVAASATYRAKFWLGYPLKECNGAFGKHLYTYLLPKGHKDAREIPASYWARRKSRLADRAKRNQIGNKRLHALAIARTQIGIHENPRYPNKITYNQWFYGSDVHAPWCAVFASWCLTKAGIKFHHSYCPEIWSSAQAKQHGLQVVGTPKPGDLVLYNFGGGVPNHVEILENRLSGGDLQTIGGNTSSGSGGSQNNGGGVYRRHRARHYYVVGFVRVG